MQFKAACDQVYEKVRGQSAPSTNVKFADVTKVKEALIAEAEALAESTDWAATADKLKNLQGAVEDSPVICRASRATSCGSRFRAACDKFFERQQADARRASGTRSRPTNLRQQAGADRARTARLLARRARRRWLGQGDRSRSRICSAEWKDIGFVPRREADAVYKAFRAACDSLFAKRDEPLATGKPTRTAPRSTLCARRPRPCAAGSSAEPAIEPVDLVARAIALRAKAAEHDALFAADILAMVRHVVTAPRRGHQGYRARSRGSSAAKPREADRARRGAAPEAAGAAGRRRAPGRSGLAAQAGDAAERVRRAALLRRDPREVIDELRATWPQAGPLLDDADHAQVERFEAVIARALGDEPARGGGGGAGAGAGAGAGDGGRRRRRDRHDAQQPVGGAAVAHGAAAVHVDPSAEAPEPLAPLAVAAVPSAVPAISPVTVIPTRRRPRAPRSPRPTSWRRRRWCRSRRTMRSRARRTCRRSPRSPWTRPPVTVEPPRRSKPTTVLPPPDEMDTGWGPRRRGPDRGPARGGRRGSGGQRTLVGRDGRRWLGRGRRPRPGRLAPGAEIAARAQQRRRVR